MARRRRGAEEEHENHERWLVSYADFITLLFAFFVVMYSVSSVNEGKFRVLSDTLVAAFKSSNRSMNPIQIGKLARSPMNEDASLMTRPVAINPIHHGKPGSGNAPPDAAKKVDPDATGDAAPKPPPAPGSPEAVAAEAAAAAAAMAGEGMSPEEIAGKGALAEAMSGDTAPGDTTTGEPMSTEPTPAQPLPPIDPLADLETVATRVESTMSSLIDQKLVNVHMGDSWVEVEVNTSILFDSGSARLAPDALPVLTNVAEILKALPNPIQVEGYTDNVPISTEAYPSNWELSAARAASVVHLFMKAGIRPQRMAAIGYGEYQPVDDNDTPEGRRRNRRVVIVIPAEKDARQTIDLQRLAAERARAAKALGTYAAPAADAALGKGAARGTGEAPTAAVSPAAGALAASGAAPAPRPAAAPDADAAFGKDAALGAGEAPAVVVSPAAGALAASGAAPAPAPRPAAAPDGDATLGPVATPGGDSALPRVEIARPR